MCVVSLNYCASLHSKDMSPRARICPVALCKVPVCSFRNTEGSGGGVFLWACNERSWVVQHVLMSYCQQNSVLGQGWEEGRRDLMALPAALLPRVGSLGGAACCKSFSLQQVVLPVLSPWEIYSFHQNLLKFPVSHSC